MRITEKMCPEYLLCRLSNEADCSRCEWKKIRDAKKKIVDYQKASDEYYQQNLQQKHRKCGRQECVYWQYLSEKTQVDRILCNDPATIVFWKDGTKTIVKRMEEEEMNPYTAFCAALAKKIYGSNSRVRKIVRKTEFQEVKQK